MHFFARLPSVIALYLVSLSAGAFSANRPNVLLILADDLGFSDLSCYGSEIPTPNIDRLASNGARFDSFYTSARCCPSRASLITGLHPHETGIGSFATAKSSPQLGPAYTGHLLPDTATLAEILGGEGYSTWMVGKWHMGTPGPIERGFQNYYGYRNFLAYAENQWDPNAYVRLPEGTEAEITLPRGDYYATDVFTDYALEFLKQARSGDHAEKPWFLYLAHSSPHFPIQAPKKSIDRHMATYRQGWDYLRVERFERQKKLGLISADATLPPLSEVPVDRDDITNGFSSKPNPSWKSLPEDRREDLARRMATFAAMVEHVDQGIGRILDDLEKGGELDNTLILFLSDNGACYEWGPFGFDGPSRKGTTKLHRGDEINEIGQDRTYQSYGSAWANLGNTPLSMYKHFCHEGGIASPLVAHWPDGFSKIDTFIREPSHLMDIVPTVCEATGVPYPEKRGDQAIKPMSGTSLMPALKGGTLVERPLAFEHQDARGIRLGDWKAVWGKRQADEVRWELYNLSQDRPEQHDLAKQEPERLNQLIATWEEWARAVGAQPFASKRGQTKSSDNSEGPLTPKIANKAVVIISVVNPEGNDGVIAAHGGNRWGYALHLDALRPTFDLRLDGKVTRIQSIQVLDQETEIVASYNSQSMILKINGSIVAEVTSPGLIPIEPVDSLSIGSDERTAAGDYQAPNSFTGKIISCSVTATSDHPQTKKEESQLNESRASKPLFADPHYEGSCDPEVVWNEATKEWFIYYTARRATRKQGTYVGTPIGVISSPDLLHWTFRGYCSFDGKKGQPDNEDTHWAPGVIVANGMLHMFATYKDNAKPPWGGKGVIRHYIAPMNDPIDGWKLSDVPPFNQPDPIDASLIQIGDEFRAYYRVGKGGGIQWATSTNLKDWENRGKCPGDINSADRGFGYQEAPYVFEFGGYFWMLTDPHDGLAVFRSADGITWEQKSRILLEPGTGHKDNTRARHPSVAVKDGKAYILYHVEPNRPYPTPPAEERSVTQKKTFLQIAELRIESGELVCDRNQTVAMDCH